MGPAAPAGERSPFHSLPSSSSPACPPRGHPSISVSWAPQVQEPGFGWGSSTSAVPMAQTELSPQLF